MTDTRYSVPTLALYVAPDEAAARRLALRDLIANPNHQAREVLEGDRLVFVERRSHHSS